MASFPTPEEIADQARRYHLKRRKWAWNIGRPYSQDIDKPEPGEIDWLDEEAG